MEGITFNLKHSEPQELKTWSDPYLYVGVQVFDKPEKITKNKSAQLLPYLPKVKMYGK